MPAGALLGFALAPGETLSGIQSQTGTSTASSCSMENRDHLTAMPFCTSCREEYRPGFTVCADCGSPLVDELPREEPAPTEGAGGSHGGWDTVAEVGQRYEAELIADRLRDCGIEAEVVDQTFRQEPLTKIAAFSVVRVLVPVDRADVARRVLSEPMEALGEDAEVGAPEAEASRSEVESRPTIRIWLLGLVRAFLEFVIGRYRDG